MQQSSPRPAVAELSLVRPFEFTRIITLFLLLSVATVSAQTRDYPRTPKDKPVHAEGAQQMTDIERGIQPYVAKERKTYPAAKGRFLAGLRPKYLFSLTRSCGIALTQSSKLFLS